MHYFLLIFVVLGIIFKCCIVMCDVIDICDESRSRIYVPVGSSGFISTKTSSSFFTTCHLQVMSCHSCIIVINIWLLEMNQKCSEDQANRQSECLCDRLEITEPFDQVYSRKVFCSQSKASTNLTQPMFSYRSQTRGVGISFVHSREYVHPFTIEYTAKYNKNLIEVDVNPFNLHSASGTISSPFFPIQYPGEFRSQYRIQCSVTTREKCSIRLIFTDHRLADQSILEFFEENQKRIGIVTGRVFRPPVIISNGPMLSFNFYANRGSGFGFKANYSVIVGDVFSAALKPNTACGGLVESIGGTIKMIRMTNSEDAVYDCIWIIKPLQPHLNLKTHLYLKVTGFVSMGKNSQLDIHQGITSSHLLLQRITHSGSNWTYDKNVEHVTNINSGLYISLRGTFNENSKLAISYAAFSFSHSHNLGKAVTPTPTDHDCYWVTDFLCQNHRCIDNRLKCDGFDHCGDNSDETNCNFDPHTSKWGSEAQNYYFPTSEDYAHLPSGFFVTFCASFVTFLISSACCALIYRTKYQHDYNQLHAVSQIMASVQQQRSPDQFTAENGYVEEPPPEYDFPPNYQDVFVYNTMKKVISDSINVQSSAIQTDLNEYVMPCCSSNVFECQTAVSHCQQINSKDENSHTIYSSIPKIEKNSTNCDSSPTCTSQFTLVEFIRSASTEPVDPERKIMGKPCKSVSNLIFDTLNPFSMYGKQFSRSMDALSSKPSYTKYYYKKIVSLTGTKET